MASTLPRLPIFEAIAAHDPKSTVVVHSASGRSLTYGELLSDVAERKERLLVESGRSDGIQGERIAFLVENSYDYVVTLLSILGTHSIALPLSPAFPPHELQYIMDQSQASMLLSSSKFEKQALDVYKEGLQGSPKHVKLEKKLGGGDYEEVKLEGPTEGAGGMMLYTSGTTNRPKGVLLPTAAMTAQAKSLITAWDYRPTDYLLHVLPLHHIHGTINAIFAPLFAGSTIEFLFPFNATAVWNRFAAPFLPTTNGHSQTNGTTLTNGHSTSPSPSPSPITFFTVVPTVYNRLLATFPTLLPHTQTAAQKAISPSHLRLNISGSAALPTPTKKAWETLSNGNILLERYGMTEVGMALSCGLPFSTRVDGSVGWPLPGVEARLYESESNSIILPGEEIGPNGKERDGEIQLRGPGLFAEYWGNEAATKKEHIEGEDGKGRWFRTGDVAVRRFVEGVSDTTGKGPMYFIHGRLSSDIIKSGGEKVSALEVERELLSLPQVLECAIVAVSSGNWGQKVGCVIVLRDPVTGGRKEGVWGPLDMRRALKGRLAGYKIPQVMKVVSGIERNAMGKVNKKVLVRKLFRDEMSGDEMSGDEKDL
ncbi:acetyl-CoA synthetase-like protein [Mollisia scopiformis]|uniref:Acetyl-CoA synthetase-like protein n=1 Tax=Mollisia scopiformis TaxID=149040 RepID=A0A194XG53_MOLSC|nr:acetyl-CoA synthetase-like protein [Mollisia scopiformis]KUJ18752.1 acetyl-CoA synthetase-like protein [Mollisia scopiformis]